MQERTSMSKGSFMKNTDCWIGVERLEERRLLAGNVTAEALDGVLTIQGDSKGNRITLTTSTTGGQFRIGGVDTTINGLSGSFDLAGVSGDVLINLGDGKNSLELSDMKLPGNLVIDTGRHGDLVRAQRVPVGGAITVRTGSGNDVVDFQGGSSGGNKRIVTDEGDDIVVIKGGKSLRLLLDTGSGDDIIFNSDHRSPLRIDDGPGMDRIGRGSIRNDDDFAVVPHGPKGWEGGFADYFKGRKLDQELKWEFRDEDHPSAAEIDHRPSLYIQGVNNTDDLFMFFTKTLGAAEGIDPDALYLVRYEIDFSSNSPSNCSGIGGAPGESVFLKAGASSIQPRVSPDEEGIQRLNVAHGQQGRSGKAVSVVGNIANGQDCPANPTFVRMLRKHIHPTLVKTGPDGSLHLIVGTESGFEGMTRLYYHRITVELMKF
jgi:hypothetical protein